ncbi:hypothetical protein BJ875DRAFT_441949 [Amylocarpus encephaloides]|uniref:C2H2-type domain-containing protein n=1 Tax=Amylocarpus encephaloides TaxID=45428 RepID=A0A9P7YHR8_9HELO|nr:hypothetical protein BJ875DRAFT_441949 [Amylocarpus encephaloides]
MCGGYSVIDEPLKVARYLIPSQAIKATQTPSIFSLSKACLDAYTGFYTALELSTTRQTDESNFDKNALLPTALDARLKFQAWAVNIDALQKDHLRTSLDFRLKEATNIRQRIIKILQGLQESLEDSILIVKGIEENDTWEVDALNDSEDERTSDSSHEAVHTSELEQLWLAIQGANANLMKMSVVIRNCPSHDDYLKAASRIKLDPRYDIVHVVEKHGSSSEDNKWMLERLGKAISRRRQYLSDREEHHGKLSRDWYETHATDEKKEAKTIASTKATTFIESGSVLKGDIIRQTQPRDEASSVGFQTPYDATMYEADANIKLTVPQPPKMAFEGVEFEFGEPFQCPYCRTEQMVKSKAAWKYERLLFLIIVYYSTPLLSMHLLEKHVFRDLRPYVCTFASCDLKMFPSRKEWFAHELQQHRRQWTCQYCEDQPCGSKEEFTKHIASKHNILYTGSQLEALVLQSEEPIDKFSASACNLCNEWAESLKSSDKNWKGKAAEHERSIEPHGTLKQFRAHLGRHMEQLALFALNGREEGDSMKDQNSKEDDVQHDISESENDSEASRDTSVHQQLHESVSSGDLQEIIPRTSEDSYKEVIGTSKAPFNLPVNFKPFTLDIKFTAPLSKLSYIIEDPDMSVHHLGEAVWRAKPWLTCRPLTFFQDGYVDAVEGAQLWKELNFPRRNEKDLESMCVVGITCGIGGSRITLLEEETWKGEEERLKAKIEDEEAKPEAAAELAKAIAAGKPPPYRKEKPPIRFKDCIGRKFTFPFHLCATWAAMEGLIQQAFLNVQIIGPWVAEGKYDMVGPNGKSIPPQVWEAVIEPGWAITMMMWPMPPNARMSKLPPLPPTSSIEDRTPSSSGSSSKSEKAKSKRILRWMKDCKTLFKKSRSSVGRKSRADLGSFLSGGDVEAITTGQGIETTNLSKDPR